ncbi:response regulator transcription factor [Clostridium ihumii]|uniref:response regulator transcription factor n=1 Tax=Clostridium ihumii TaxID=1470356 RepID=UPI00059116E7|nr:response regulator transcription factor [Clostridium ihumii]
MNILIADDDERILKLLSDYLKFNGYGVITANNGEDALLSFKNYQVDLVILDVMMPVYDGWIVCKEIRKTSNVPIIMLTAKDSDLDELFGFDIGVDDYITKPFNIALVLARIKRLLKPSNNNLLTFKGISIDEATHSVKLDDINVDLNPKEYAILLYFLKNINIVISRDTLLTRIWGDTYFGDTRTVDTHINRLRNKLGAYSTYLQTIRGYGYKLGE